MELKSLKEMKEEFNRMGAPQSMTQLDRMRQALTNAIAQRIHKHIKPHPHAIDEDDVIVEREGWLTVEEIMAATYINAREIGADPYECFTEAAKRNVV